MYKNYIFDLYGTLVDIRTNENKVSLWKNMANIFAMHGAYYTPTELKETYEKLVEEQIKKVPPEKYTTTPEPQIEYVFQNMFSQKGVEADMPLAIATGKTFRALSLKFIRLYDGVPELFDAIEAHGGNAYLLSNAQRIFTEPEIRRLGIYDRFKAVIISSDEGCAKPDINFYKQILDRYDLDPKESIMIGNDYRTDIQGSHNAGLDSLYIHTAISPKIAGDCPAKYKVMNGNVYDVIKILFG